MVEYVLVLDRKTHMPVAAVAVTQSASPYDVAAIRLKRPAAGLVAWGTSFVPDESLVDGETLWVGLRGLGISFCIVKRDTASREGMRIVQVPMLASA